MKMRPLLKNPDEYINGILKITEGNGDQFGIFTASYEDEALMTGICERLAA